MPIFDCCLITASDERQARVFRSLVEARRRAGLYPREIDFRVYADPPGGRVGSGGGTVWALSRYVEEAGAASVLGSGSVLLVHAGGESRRLPAYVPEGKLFAPLPAPSSSHLPPVVLDLELGLFMKYPWRRGELLVASGDVIIDFDAEILSLPDAPLCGFAAPDSYERGSRHGVFAFDPVTGLVRDFFQKESPARLAASARIEGTDHCAVDLGIVSFRGKALEALLAFGRASLPEGRVLDLLEAGRLSFDLYREILMAGIGGQGLEAYRARLPRGPSFPPSAEAALHGLVQPCGLAGVLVRKPAFIHFGSLAEFPAACREQRERFLEPFYGLQHEELLPEAGEELVRFNCRDASIELRGAGVCAENCSRIELACEGDNLLSGLRDLRLAVPLPKGFCLDQRTFASAPEGGGRPRLERAILVYHADDSFKPADSLGRIRFCARPLDEWLAERGLEPAEVLPRGGADLYEAALFPVGAEASFLPGYWRLPEDPAAWAARFRASRRLSLAEANALSDAIARDAERAAARSLALREGIVRSGLVAVSRADFLALPDLAGALPALEEAYRSMDDPLLREYRRSLLAAAGSREAAPSGRVEFSFSAAGAGTTLACALKEDQIVWSRSPLRFDLAGGWTDTPPYTNRYGGTVVNLAVDLNGQCPVQVFARRTRECVLRFHSIDLGVTETMRDIDDLRDYRNPTGPFALPRAALCLLGLGADLPAGAPLAPALERAGGGLELTILCAVPKGSGLGTSSILAGTILAALGRFYGISAPPEELYLGVLELEQMLTTGGGWQDQIGGLVGGVKYCESRPALLPRPIVHHLDSWLFVDPSSTGRMTLFYTGITRLAKSILKDVVDRVDGMDRSFLFTHGRLRELAGEAREAIALRDLDALARVVDASFRENKLIHESTSNEQVEAMMAAARPHVSGAKLLGAGGGGYAFFVSPDAESARRLRKVLAEDFEDERARLVDFSLNERGLETTVS